MTCKILQVLAGTPKLSPPLWMMRQAGRHLPEYRQLRARAGSFLTMCSTPSFAVEASLQPLHRYGVDAVIIFSDILLVLEALGQELRFEESGGPALTPLSDPGALSCDSCRIVEALDKLSHVQETISQCRKRADTDVAVIGFAGAPWTLSTYAIQGRVAGDTTQAQLEYFRDRPSYHRLIACLVEAVAGHLAQQARAGADVLMLFDSWAGSLDHASFSDLVISPTTRLVSRLRQMGIDTPVIGFPRKCGGMLNQYAALTGVDCVGLDPLMEPGWVCDSIPAAMAVQGNLHPLVLRAGGDVLDQHIDALLAGFSGRPLIVNLGHGVMPDTPVAHVERLVARVRSHSGSA